MGLIIDRFAGERIFIGEDVQVEVTSARRGKARLNIIAPDCVPVDREEIRRQKNRATVEFATGPVRKK